MPVGMHAADGHCAARSCLRHQTCRVGFPRRVLLQRRIALASADPRRHSISDAALSAGNPRLDQPARRAHAASHHDAWPGSGGALPILPLTAARPKSALRNAYALLGKIDTFNVFCEIPGRFNLDSHVVDVVEPKSEEEAGLLVQQR